MQIDITGRFRTLLTCEFSWGGKLVQNVMQDVVQYIRTILGEKAG